MLFYFLLFLAGLAGGLISGLLGVGGGIIYILILPAALQHLGVPVELTAQFTIANSLLGTFFAATFSTINHIRNKEFYPKAILIVSVGAAIAGVLSLYFIVNTPFYSREVFNIVVIFILIAMLISTLLNAKKQLLFEERKVKIKRLMGITGIFAGTTAALTGLGGGIVIIPFLNQGLKIGVKRAKAISLGVITITSFIMVIYNMLQQPMHAIEIPHTGYIMFQLALPIIVGALLSAKFGVKLSRKMKPTTVSYMFAAFIILVIIKKLIELI